MSEPILLEEAWERLFALVRAIPSGAETVSVDEAAGRYLARDVIARRTQPDANLSVMDGYAVAGPGPWPLVGESRAGVPFARPLSAGQAVQISTGAACPSGAEGIVILEDATVDAGLLYGASPEPGRWIRRRGFDFVEGAPLIAAGAAIGPVQIALSRAAGCGTLEVARRPLVAVIECGDELVAAPESCPPGRLPASNGAMVAAMARSVGARVSRDAPLPDDRGELAMAIGDAADAHVIVTTAGASVGEHDHVRGALDDCGADLAFWRVAIRPGKPLLVARRGGQIILGLPGNPASSFVTAFLFLLPLLRALQGAAKRLPIAVPISLASALPAGGERREFQRGLLQGGLVVPLDERDSSALRTLAEADILIDRPIGAPPAPAGATVPCYWIGNGYIA